MAEASRAAWDAVAIRAHAERFSRERFERRFEAILAESLTGGARMLRRYNRLLVVCFTSSPTPCRRRPPSSSPTSSGSSGPFVELVPVTKTQPPFSQYLMALPVVAVLVPLAFQMQGLYRLRRGRTRVDDFFAVLVGSMLAVLAGVVRLAVRTGVLPRAPGLPSDFARRSGRCSCC